MIGDVLVSLGIVGAVAFLTYGWVRITGPLGEVRQAKEDDGD